jgi:hypothetical protein
MRITIVDIPGGGTTTGPDTDANLYPLLLLSGYH